MPAAERCRLLSAEKNAGDGHAACNAALKYGDVASTLVYDAHLFVQEKRNDEALARIERALRVDPQDSEALRIRQGLRIDLADYLGAARDLVLIRHLEPANGRIAQRITWLVKKLTYEGQERFKAGKATEAAPYFQLGLELDPDNLDLMHRQGWAARDQVDALLAEASTRPDDFDLRLRIDHAFASKGQFADVVKMWDESNAPLSTAPKHQLRAA